MTPPPPPSQQHVEVHRGRYHDSVALLAAGRQVAAVDGVAAAQVAMGTPLNLDVLATMGFALPAVTADDLVVALRFAPDADPAAVRESALGALAAALRRPEPAGDAAPEPPRTTGAALRRRPAPVALVSVPGPHATVEALDALRAGTSVMVFSDHVSVRDEVLLKREAAERGLLVMGPDCGTAVLGGVGLGFANVTRPGPVSLVAASGTGAQHLLSLLDAADVGVRHCLGVGGRDLSAAVGGLAAEQALRALAAEAATELVVLVSKPADAGVLRRLRSVARSLGTPLEVAALGAHEPDLTAAAERVCRRLGRPVPTWPEWPPAGPAAAAGGAAGGGAGLLRGLFCGGSLCDEATALAAATLGPVASTTPLADSWPRLDASGPSALAAALADAGHAMVDLGDDALTAGRAHPMIDPSLRLTAIAAAAADPRVRVLLLDVVLGHGSHADPAGEHGPALQRARRDAAAAGRRLDVVVSLTGTRDDPQGRDAQAGALAAAGAHVHASNAAAARRAVAVAAGATP